MNRDVASDATNLCWLVWSSESPWHKIGSVRGARVGSAGVDDCLWHSVVAGHDQMKAGSVKPNGVLEILKCSFVKVASGKHAVAVTVTLQ